MYLDICSLIYNILLFAKCVCITAIIFNIVEDKIYILLFSLLKASSQKTENFLYFTFWSLNLELFVEKFGNYGYQLSLFQGMEGIRYRIRRIIK